MRVAAPVQALSCSTGVWRLLPRALYALTGVVSAYWVGSHLAGGGPWVAVASLALGLGGVAWAARGTDRPPLRLNWDGVVWAVHSSEDGRQPGQVMLMLDLGGWMLVRFTPSLPHGAHKVTTQWLPLSARDTGASWAALRVALYARQAAGDLPAVPPRHSDAA